MKIRYKLVGMVLVIFALFGAAVGAYFLLTARIGAIEAEKLQLAAVSRTLNNLRVSVNRLDSLPLGDAREELVASRAAFSASIDGIQGMRVLPSLSAEIQGALETLAGIKEMIDARFEPLVAALDALVENSSRFAHGASGGIAVPELMDELYGSPDEAAPALMFQTVQFRNKAKAIDFLLISQDEIIGEQYATIDALAEAGATEALTGALAIVAVILGACVAMALIMANRLARSVESIGAHAQVLASGDLTHSFETNRKDEIGALSAALNGFLESLNGAIGSMRGASERSQRVKEELIAASQDASSSIVEIESNSESISRQIGLLNGQVEATAKEVSSVSGGVVELNQSIMRQKETVGAALASLKGILEELEKVVGSAEEGAARSDRLKKELGRSKDEFASTYASIMTIHEKVDTINSIASVMEGISSQTNLLAMNAAIEAAHAGAYGKGFAVVANEIRSLAEASAQSSREISKNLGEIVAEIGRASELAGAASGSFGSMDAGMSELDRAIASMRVQVRGTMEAGRGVADAIGSLERVSAGIESRSAAMEASAKAIGAGVADLERISSEVCTNTSEIDLGIHHIGESIMGVAKRAEAMGEISAELDASIRAFKTRDREEAVEA